MGIAKKPRRSCTRVAGQGQTAIGPPGPFQHGEDFVFELRGKRTQIMDSELIAALRARAADVGRPFSMREFDDWPGRPCSACTIQVRFGDWRRALALAGIEGGRRSNYTPEELIQNLEAAWRTMGRAPGHHTIRLHSTVGPGPYIRVWGGVRRACLLFSRYKRGQITRRALLRPVPPRRPKPVSKRARWRILERDGHRCAGCGRAARDPGVRLEVDHVTPRSAGGPSEAVNLRALCQDCNRGKGPSIPAQPLLPAIRHPHQPAQPHLEPAGRNNESLVREHEVGFPRPRAPEGSATSAGDDAPQPNPVTQGNSR